MSRWKWASLIFAAVMASAPAAAPSAWYQMPARGLLGQPLVDRDGKLLGRVADLVLDVRNARVESAVLAFDWGAGPAEDRYAAPIAALSLAPGGERIVLTKPLALLRAPQELERDLPERTPLRQYVRASELIDRTATDRTGARAGEIDDVVLDLKRELVLYMVFDWDKASVDRPALKLAPQDFSFPLEGGAAVLNAAPASPARAPR